MLKKLFFIITIFCLFNSKNIICDKYKHYHYSQKATLNTVVASIYALSALFAYTSHKILCNSKFYHETVTPITKKVCFFMLGTEAINNIILKNGNNSLINLSNTVASGIIAYKLNDILNENDMYREKINPFAKKVSLFYTGTCITFATSISAIAFVNAILSQYKE